MLSLPASVVPILDEVAKSLHSPPDFGYPDPKVVVALGAREPGWAIYLAYLWKATGKAAYRSLGERLLRRAIAGVPEASDRPHLGFGFVGTAWAIEHLKGWFLRVDGDVNAEVDDALEMLVEKMPDPPFDLQYGLVGYGVYALERPPRPGRALLERVLARLEQLAVRTRDGFHWRLPPEWCMSPDGAKLGSLAPLGVFNGAAGVVALAAAARERGIASRRAQRLAEGALGWMWAHRLGADAQAMFPHHAATTRGSPWSWAAGDLGIGAAMLRAARAFGLGIWEARALRVLRALARRPARGVPEPSLLAGAAGVAHVFRRLADQTGDPLLRDAASRWLSRLVRLRRSGRGLAGYRFFSPHWQRRFMRDPNYPTGWLPRPGLFNGVAGVGLALLSATTREAAWDRVLLLS